METQLHLFNIIAIACAGLYFLWKTLTGWFIANLDLEIQAERQSKDGGADYLAVTLILKKGNVDAIWLEDLSFRISNHNTKVVLITEHLDEFRSLEKNGKHIHWSPASREFAISPGETFRFCKIVEIPASAPILIEAAMAGRRWLWHFQWRSSTASLGLTKG